MGYTLSQQAEEDIIGIFLRGAQEFGYRQAELYHLQLEEIFRFLSENPQAAPERTEIFPPVRIHPFGAHIVVYNLDENGDVFIIRVRHGHENWQDSTGDL